MMQTKAYDTGTNYLFRVHLDETKVIPDPTLPAPEEGQEDTRPLVPDPTWVLEYTWVKDTQMTLADMKTEAERLAALDPRIQPAPTEIVLPI